MAGSSRTIEMTWVCSSCGHRNLGRHKACEQCGNPKDASETFEMPGSTSAAPTVTDPKLLGYAKAGVDWRCTYCGTDNRALAAGCVHCGAERGGTPNVKQLVQPGPPVASRPRPRSGLAALLGSSLVLVIMLSAGVVFAAVIGVALSARRHDPPAPLPERPEQPRIVAATVTSREWRTTLRAERRRLIDHEGFEESRPADALEVRQDGVRHHHDEQVFDHYEDETYYEDVPYQDTETYTEQVQCGEDCVDTPETCSEHCSDDGNGFATCTTECSGGGRSCSPRYCTETRTRPVTRTRSEARTRQVARTRPEPRDAPWYRWRTWEWTPDRQAVHSGSEEAPSWPDEAELGAAAPLGEGEEDREHRDAFWIVHVREDEKGREHTITPPALDDLARYPVGASVTLETWWDGRAREVAATGSASSSD